MLIEEGKIKITIHFQYQGPHDLKPRDWTQEENLQFEAPAGTPVRSIPLPAVGDNVTLTLTEPGRPLAYKVLTRTFSYAESGPDLLMDVYIIVTDVPSNEGAESLESSAGARDRLHWVLAAVAAILLVVSTGAVVAFARAHRQAHDLAAANQALHDSVHQMEVQVHATGSRKTSAPNADPHPKASPATKNVTGVPRPRPSPSTLRPAAPLGKKGERSFYEFQLARSGQYQRVGPFRIAVRQVGLLQNSCELLLTTDGRRIERERVNLYKPLLLSKAPRQPPLELVVDEITDKTVKGYLSEPKHSKSEIAAVR